MEAKTLNVYTVTVPGKIVGKKSVQVGRGRAYLPKAVQNYIDLVYWTAKAAVPKTITRPVFIRLFAYFEYPKSWTIKKKTRAAKGELVPTSARIPDADNIEKAVFDGLDGGAKRNDGAILNDKQVFWHETIKAYSGRSRLIIQIHELDIEGG